MIVYMTYTYRICGSSLVYMGSNANATGASAPSKLYHSLPLSWAPKAVMGLGN